MSARKVGGAAAGALVVLAVTPVLFMFMAAAGTSEASGQELNNNCLTPTATVKVPTLTPEQSRNASTIVQVGLAHKVPTQGLVIAIAASLQESTLHNYNFGDRDSLGLFQQRPSAGWGTPEQIRTPQLAAEAFFGVAKHTHNQGLLDVPGWQNMEVWEAAQAVQGSAFPTAYADDEGPAVSIVNTVLSGSETTQAAAVLPASCGGAMSCPPIQGPAAAVEDGLTPDALIVARCVHQHWPTLTLGGKASSGHVSDSDHYTGRAIDVMIGADYSSARGVARGDAIASYVQSHAREMGVTYIIWNARIWSVERASEGWRAYEYPGGPTNDDTLMHRDHVHVSVSGNAAVAPAASAGKWTLPVAPDQYRLSARFGECGGLWASCHTGLDFDTSNDPANYPPVHAAASGQVVDVIWDPQAYGNLVKISHGGGVETWYAHLDRVLVRKGQTIRAGQTIGIAGATGNTTGEHLHFEVRQGGQAIDPEPWLEAHGVNP